MNNGQTDVKIIVVGSGGVGKSSLTVQYVQGIFLERYDPTIEDDYRKLVTIDERRFLLDILDTAGADVWSAYRDYWYRRADVVLILFSVINRSSFASVVECYEAILRIKDVESWPWILVATKCDCEQERQVSASEAIDLAVKLNAGGYIEVSSKQNINVDETFLYAVSICQKNSNEFQISQLENKLKNMTKAKRALPWNWSKVYKWDKRLTKLRGVKPPPIPSIREVPEEEFLDELPSVELIPSDVFTDLEKFFNNEKTCYDLIFHSNGHILYAHKIIVALRSSYFTNLFATQEITTMKVDVEYPLLWEMIHFCYNPSRIELMDLQMLEKMRELNTIYKISGLTDIIDRKLNKLKGIGTSATFMLNSVSIQLDMSPGLRNFKYLSDVTFSVENKLFYLHKAILMSRCKFFEGMLSHNFKEKEKDVIQIESLTSAVFIKVIEYLYTGRVDGLSPDLGIEVLAASNMLGLKRLTQLCERAVQPILDADNVIAVCQAAEHHNATQLLEICIRMMVHEYPNVVTKEDFEQLSPGIIKQVNELRTKYEKELEEKKKLTELKSKLYCMLYTNK